MQASSVTMVAVKEERPDEAEIQELAEKMKEANKAKMAAPAGATPRTLTSGVNGQTTLGSYMRPGNAATAGAAANAKLPEDKKPIDEDSQRGRFGWVTLGSVHIPYIWRQGEKYTAVRMVENKLLNKYLSYLHSDIYNYTNIRSYYITDAESRLLNEINIRHCDSYFGRDHFTNKDLVVRLQDASEFHHFLEVCYNKLHYNTLTPNPRCGFIRINNESVVPYTVKEAVKFVPLFYFEGETDSLKLKAEMLEGWDLAYLKFCCKVQGIRNELFASETCSVISLDDIMSYFPSGTQFDDYWPTKVSDCQLLSKNPIPKGSWTKVPAGAAPPAAAAPTKPPVQARAFQPAQTPPSASTPGAAATLPTWSLIQQQQIQQQIQQQQQQRQLQASSTSAAQRSWQSSTLPNQYYGFHPQLSMQQQQVVPNQKSQPPPLVRNSPAPNAVLSHLPAGTLTMVENNRTYGLQKNMPMRMVAPPARFNAYGPDVMDLSGHQQQQQQQQAQYALDARLAKEKLHQIDDVYVSGQSSPYQLQKALVDHKMVPCINKDPYRYSELLMTMPDLVQHFYANFTPLAVQKILTDVLKVTLYRGNRQQIDVLRQAGKCRSEKDAPPLIEVRDVMQYMPQLKYILSNKQQHQQQQQQHQQSEQAAKRMRTS